MKKKTNAVRILELQNIPFETSEYEFNEEEIDAVSVAGKINAEPEQVFKTLVTRGNDNNYFVFIIPGNYELDLKKAAAVSGNKKVELIKVKELHDVTGYIRGGCSPVGMKKLFPSYMDESALLYERIYVSAGIRGMQVLIHPKELCSVIEGKFADIIL